MQEEHIFQALENASETFEEGAVGSGTGMCCLGLKGGIGSASRVVALDGKDYTIGALVMSNFGSAGNLTVDGRHLGRDIKVMLDGKKKDQGSIIMLLATDIRPRISLSRPSLHSQTRGFTVPVDRPISGFWASI